MEEKKIKITIEINRSWVRRLDAAGARRCGDNDSRGDLIKEALEAYYWNYVEILVPTDEGNRSYLARLYYSPEEDITRGEIIDSIGVINFEADGWARENVNVWKECIREGIRAIKVYEEMVENGGPSYKIIKE